MRIIPKNTKVSTEFFKGVTLADMVVGFIGILIVFLIAISSLPYRGYIALGFAFILVFLLVRIDDEANYMFLFRIIRHFSYFRSYQKPGFAYPETEVLENMEVDVEESTEVSTDENIDNMELDTKTPETSSDVAGDMLVLENEALVTEEPNVLVTEVSEVQVTDEPEAQTITEPERKDPLQLELEEEGFEILDLDEISVDVKSTKKVTETMTDNKKKHRKVFGKNKK